MDDSISGNDSTASLVVIRAHTSPNSRNWFDYFKEKRDGARMELSRLCLPGMDPDDPELSLPQQLDPFLVRYRVSKREWIDAESIREVWNSYESIPTKPAAYTIVLFSRAYRELSKLGVKVSRHGGASELVSILDKNGYLPEISAELRRVSELDAERARVQGKLRELLEERLQYHRFVFEDEKKLFMRYVLSNPDDMRAYIQMGGVWTGKMARFLELDTGCRYPHRRLLLERMREVEMTVELYHSM